MDAAILPIVPKGLPHSHTLERLDQGCFPGHHVQAPLWAGWRTATSLGHVSDRILHSTVHEYSHLRETEVPTVVKVAVPKARATIGHLQTICLTEQCKANLLGKAFLRHQPLTSLGPGLLGVNFRAEM